MSGPLYLLSSLETLTKDSRVQEDSFDEFFRLCERHLEHRDYTFLHDVFFAIYQGENEAALEWRSFYLMYQNFKAEHRKVPFEVQSTPITRYIRNGIPISSVAMRMCTELEGALHPLEWEEIFVKHAWALLTDIASRYFYAIENIMVYGLQLQLALRMTNFTLTRGNHNWNHITSVIAKKSGFSMESFSTNEAYNE